MTVPTKAELEADLLTLQIAYKEYLRGERSTKYVIGTGSTRREYSYQEVNASLLLEEISRLKDELRKFEPEKGFRKVHHRIAWSKR